MMLMSKSAVSIRFEFLKHAFWPHSKWKTHSVVFSTYDSTKQTCCFHSSKKVFPEGFYLERYVIKDSQLAFSLMSSSSQPCICSFSLHLLQSWQLQSSASSSRTAWCLKSYKLHDVVLCISTSRLCLVFLPHAFYLLCYHVSNLCRILTFLRNGHITSPGKGKLHIIN